MPMELGESKAGGRGLDGREKSGLLEVRGSLASPYALHRIPCEDMPRRQALGPGETPPPETSPAQALSA